MGSTEALLEQLKKTFISELPDRIDAIEAQLLSCEDSSDFESAFQEAYRKAHSLKGSGGTYGMPIITSICHQLEDTLVMWHKDPSLASNQLMLSRCLGYVDLLRQVSQAIADGDGVFKAISEQLCQLQEHFLASKLRCLLVESSRTTRQICQQALAEYNTEVVVMEDGYKALGRLLHEKFDLLIVGMEIGPLNGITLISTIKQIGSQNKNIRSIIITSSPKSIQVGNRNTDPSVILNKGAEMVDGIQDEVTGLLNSKNP